MRKIVILIIPLILVNILTAVNIDIDGVLRTRAAVYNDLAESTDGHIDNRLRLGMSTELAPGLNFRTRLQFGNVTWGDAATGGSINSAVKISAYELYLEYLVYSIDARIRFGQQCWADPLGLIIDGSFSGIMLSTNELIGFKAELGFIKVLEVDDFDHDGNYFLANISSSFPIPWGILTSAYYQPSINNDSYTLMPYLDMSLAPLRVRAAAFMGAHINNPNPTDIGLGTAIKSTADLGAFKIGADILFATKNGIATLFPYYKNGLYIYGIGHYNDSVNLYWKTPYSDNTDNTISTVGSITVPVTRSSNVFCAAGYLSKQGYEVNVGFDHDLIPSKMKVAGYAAAGVNEDTDITNYVMGIAVVVPF